MVKRVFFWLGIFLGAISVFGLRQRRLPPALIVEPNPLLGLIGEAVVVCDSAGTLTYLNSIAQEWFGADGEGALQLCYPSGQPVPSGQIPLTRALRTGKPSEGTGYLCLSPDGAIRTLEISARPLAAAGAAAIFRDITEIHETQARKTEAERREEILRRLCRQLSAAATPEDLARGIVESALALAQPSPGAQVRLYAYDLSQKQLTRLASAPEDRPKRPRSQTAAQPVSFAFDAKLPLLWQVYVAREPFCGTGEAMLGEDPAAVCFALPLLAGGAVIGHLSLTCSRPEALHNSALGEAFTLLSSIAALALAGPSQAAQTAHLADQVLAIREIAGAVAKRVGSEALADLVAGCARRVLGAEVCLMAIYQGGQLRPVGDDYKDGLLYPERHAPDDPALTHGATEKAARIGKAVRLNGQRNPDMEIGLWRAFVGQSGRHSVLAVPLPGGQGAITVYRAGETSFNYEQAHFLETLAGLTAAALPSATLPANHTGS